MSAFPTTRQISIQLDAESCVICFDSIGGPSRHIDDLRLGCGCAVHYCCIVEYVRSCIKTRQGDGGQVVSLRREGIKCPNGKANAGGTCKAMKVQGSSEDPTLPPSTAGSASSSVYYLTVDEMDNIADYGLEDAAEIVLESSSSSSGGIVGDAGNTLAPRGRVLNVNLLERLKESSNMAPLTHEEVADFRRWIKDTKEPQQDISIDPNDIDPYVNATTKACPTCSFRSTHYHCHDQCHHISPQTNGCPNCHVHYCYKCLSSEKDNLKDRGKRENCLCGFWSSFCRPIKSTNDVKMYVEYFDGIPRDKRCGCTFCPLCREGQPCKYARGACDCSVCLGYVHPGPLDVTQKWGGACQSSSKLRGQDTLAQAKAAFFDTCRQGESDSIADYMTFTDSQGVVHNFINEKDGAGKTPLIFCCEGNHDLCLSILLADPTVDVNLADNDLQTPLHWACKYGSIDCVNLLLAYPNIDINLRGGADRDIRNMYVSRGPTERGETALLMAATEGHQEVVETLIYAIADEEGRRAYVENQANDGETALHKAAYRGHADSVETLINVFSDEEGRRAFLQILDMDGRTALHKASLCSRGNDEDLCRAQQILIETLINAFSDEEERRAYVEIQDREGCTALHFCATEGYLDTVEILINSIADEVERRAYVQVQNNDGCTALHNAALSGHSHVVETLINAVSDEEGRRAFLQILDMDGRTVLHNAALYYASSYSYLIPQALAETIIEAIDDEEGRRAFIQIQDNKGCTSLHYSAYEGYDDVVKTLINTIKDEEGRKAYVQIQNNDGETALHKAAYGDQYSVCGDHQGVVKTLINTISGKEGRREYVDMKANSGETSLHMAASYGYESIVETLERYRTL